MERKGIPAVWFGLPLLLNAACARTAPPLDPPRTDAALAALSDDFDQPASLRRWRRADREEGGVDQLARADIGQTRPGWLTLVPRTSVWYRDYRGVLLYQAVHGDFVVTTRLRVRQRGGDGAPRSAFSLAGIMVRAPRTRAENYVFLSLGSADSPGRYQLEVKTTVASDSQLQISAAPSGDARIQVARIGHTLLMLVDDGRGWRVHRRYERPDFPDTLQAGLTVYTDWPGASRIPPERHNATALDDGNPDLDAAFDYVRYRRPRVPAALAGRSLADPRAVSDRELLAFLGENAER